MSTEISNKIRKLINDIRYHSYLSNSLVADIVDSNQLNEKDIAPYYSFEHSENESYGRQLIYDNGNFKILLMSWKSGDFTAIHNHGYTEWGCVYFFGEATHRLYSVDDNELKLIKKENFQKGQIAYVCGDLTHMMGNSGTTDFATLHIYGSNTRRKDISKDAVVYLPEFDKEVTTMGSAYLNMDKKYILSEKPLLSIATDLLADYYNLVKPFYERNNHSGILKNIDNKLYNSNYN
jgi:predicted metal-dependent enzyme (double-stranded beta helix superfamily)